LASKEGLLNMTPSRLVRLAGSVSAGSGVNRSFSSAEPLPDSPTPPSSSLISVPTAMIENTASPITMTVPSKMIKR